LASGSDKVVYAALVGNIGVAASKYVAAAITGSPAMLAEAFHSTADSGNELLLLIGRKRSRRPPDQEHPFGHGRELYFWAFIVAMSIFAVGGGLSIYEGITRLIHPEPLGDATWNYVVIGVAAVFEGFSWNVSYQELKRRRGGNESIWQVIHGSKDPSLYTVFIEDTTALLGLAVAFLGVLLSHIWHASVFDAGSSVVIGLLLVLASAALAVETGGLLVGEAADSRKLDDIRRIIAAEDTVESVGDVLTMQLSPNEVLLVADVNFRRDLGTEELERCIDKIEQRVRERHPSVTRIFFEADSLKKKRAA
jgi:cation diffusion facilitator family transporter